MLFILWRLLIRLVVLVVIVLSIFYFYVLWYTFNKNVWFIKANGVYAIQTFSSKKSNNIMINSNFYYIVDNKITLHWIYPTSCGYIKIWDYAKYVCYNKNNKHYLNIVYIPRSDIKLEKIKSNIFANLDLYQSSNPYIKYYFYFKWIKFIYYKNGDILYEDDIDTKKLANIKNLEFVWYDSNGLYVVKNDKLYYLNLHAN